LFERRFEVVDDFLGDDVGYNLKKMALDTFISSACFPLAGRRKGV
jgi:hypothetical protein